MRRTVLVLGLGLLACGDRTAPPAAEPDLAALALDDRARTIDHVPPPRGAPGPELRLVADIPAGALMIDADLRVCLRRTRTAVCGTITPEQLARLDAALDALPADPVAYRAEPSRRPRRVYVGRGRHLVLVGDLAPDQPLAAFEADVDAIARRLDFGSHSSDGDDRLLLWHARSELTPAGAVDDELWVFADGRLLLRRSDARGAVTLATRRVGAADLAFLTVALDRPIADTDTLRALSLAPGTGHRLVLPTRGRELVVDPGAPVPPGLGPILGESVWLRRAFAD